MTDVTVTREPYGPFTRIVVAAGGGPRTAMLSVYRVGDLLIDTGGTRVEDALVQALRDDPPRRIVCTHQHEDHVGGVGAIRRAFGALPVHVPRMHVPLLPGFDRIPPYRAAFWGAPRPIHDAIPYDPGDVFEAGGVALDARLTPGHTPGHIAFVAHVGSERLALTGDLYTSTPFLAWHESAADDLIRSCRALAAERVQMLPTHGRARLDGAAALGGLADRVERTAEQIERAAARLGTRDVHAVARAVLGPEDPMAEISVGEFSYAGFARSVLDPVRALPAPPIF